MPFVYGRQPVDSGCVLGTVKNRVGEGLQKVLPVENDKASTTRSIRTKQRELISPQPPTT